MAAASNIRDLYPYELTILKTLSAHEPTASQPGCPIDDVAEAIKPQPHFEAMTWLIQQGVIDHPVSDPVHRTQQVRFLELTAFGQEVLKLYDSGKRKTQKPPRLPNRKELEKAGVPSISHDPAEGAAAPTEVKNFAVSKNGGAAPKRTLAGARGTRR